MWLSRQMRPEMPTADADLGMTSISGERVGVVTRGEVREVPIYGPGGYVWMPENGAEVLVIKGGPGGEEQCVSGMRQAEPPKGMQPGEICIQGPKDTAVYLKQDGSIELRAKRVDMNGTLYVNGVLYMPCACKS